MCYFSNCEQHEILRWGPGGVRGWWVFGKFAIASFEEFADG